MAFEYSDPKEAFAEAERRIEECMRQEETSLDLSDLGLTTLPVYLGELKQLESLELNSNQLRELPASLGELKQLRWLALTDNQFRELPSFLGELKQLRWLWLNVNHLHELPAALSELKQLQQLHLEGNPDLGLPPWVVANSNQPAEILDYYFQHHPPSISRPLSLFISYSHVDDDFRNELRGALTPYERNQELKVWDDTRIEPGQKWDPEILVNLERADIIVLLLSNDFIGSDYCMQKEWEAAKKRDTAGQCAIVPIVVRDCRYDKLPLGQLQAIIPRGKPIKSHRDRDAAWLAVTKQLDRVIARLKKQRGK